MAGILYLHGFTSGPQSQKARLLHARMTALGMGDQFICPQLPHSPRAAIALAEEIIGSKVGAGDTGRPSGRRWPAEATPKRHGTDNRDTPSRHGTNNMDTPLTLVGSSLGGYYATWLAEKHGLRAVLVNPAVVAHIALQRYIGPQQNIYSGERFDFTREHIEELRALDVPLLTHPENFWLLGETGDETLDYRQAVDKYRGARQTILPGGDHGFTRWADYIDDIIACAD